MHSASELDDDIQNYLQGRPLLAGPETVQYRLRKFLRRHRNGVLATAAIFILIFVLVISLITQTRQALKSRAAESIRSDATTGPARNRR